jgi:adenosine kinase
VAFLVPEMRREFGGCAANIAYNLRLLGDDAIPMAAVGHDFGPYAERFRANGIPLDHIRVVPEAFTAQAYITTDVDDNQITAFHPGAMQHSHLAKISDVAGPIALGIVAPDGRQAMIEHAAQLAAAGVPFIFDPGQGLPMFDAQELRTFIAQSTWVAVNDYEWGMLQQKTGWDAAELAQRVEALIVTRAGDGSEIHTKERTLMIPCAKPRALVDPTGCGDAYRAGLIHGLLRGLDWETTGRIASLMGALKIEARGPQNHRFTRSQFEARFTENFGLEAARTLPV